MGVYIKGMEIPENCEKCRISRLSGYGHAYCPICQRLQPVDYPRPQYCPLVPVPRPGRLKKRIVYRGEVYDALEAARVESLDGILTDPYKEGIHDGLKRALQILANKVKDAPVIIMEEDTDCHTSDTVTGSQ